MMRFKNWLLSEIVELKKPSKISKTKYVKNASTNTATSAFSYNFTTKLNNKVKIEFLPSGENEYRITFWVNGEVKSNLSGRDPEILPGVFYIIRDRADRLKAQKLRFEAYKDEKDKKTVKNIDLTPYIQDVFNKLNAAEYAIKSYKITMMQPSQTKIDLYKRLNRPEPQPFPDLDVQRISQEIARSKGILNNLNPENCLSYLGELNNLVFNENIPFVVEIQRSLQHLTKVISSYYPDGMAVDKNRRAAIYEKLLNRNFANWDIERKQDFFTLTRKTTNDF